MPAPTPYDGTSRPFSIGLRPVEPENWLDIAGDDPAQMLAEKDRLIAERPRDVFAAEEKTDAAQREVLALVADFVTGGRSGRWRRDGSGITVAGRTIEIERPREPPLQAAGRLVADDFVLMRNGPDGWRLAAASLCFPSSWVLAEKFGKPIGEIHGPVPGFAAGTRNDELISRMFDRLQPAVIVERFNWSLQANASLFHPLADKARDERARGTAAVPRAGRLGLGLRAGRAADPAQASRFRRHPVHHPHPRRSVAVDRHAPRRPRTGRIVRCPAVRTERGGTRLQGPRRRPRPAGRGAAHYRRNRAMTTAGFPTRRRYAFFAVR